MAKPDEYSNVVLNRIQARQICFAIIADIEKYAVEHLDEFEEFLRNENPEREGGEQNVKQ